MGFDPIKSTNLCFLPIWANANTVSFEPYLQTQVLPGGSYAWEMRYHL